VAGLNAWITSSFSTRPGCADPEGLFRILGPLLGGVTRPEDFQAALKGKGSPKHPAASAEALQGLVDVAPIQEKPEKAVRLAALYAPNTLRRDTTVFLSVRPSRASIPVASSIRLEGSGTAVIVSVAGRPFASLA